jgi:Fe-S oxidoreductase
MLERAGKTGLPIVCVEPSQTLFIRHDYRKNGISNGADVLLPQEFLHQRLRAGDSWGRTSAPAEAKLILHCSEASTLKSTRSQWQEVFAALGTAVTIPDVGCCGMAGLYGHQQRHQNTSRKLFDLTWAEHADGELHATGFSCRCQVDRFAGAGPRHPLALLTGQSR